MKSKPTFNEALLFWLKLGFISFGGPAGQISIMHEYLVTQKKWISESKFMHALNYCMILPGPEAQQLATYIGWLLHGTKGGLVAGVLFVLPSMFILLGLSIVYVTYGNIPWVYAMFDGLKPAVIAIVLLALIKIGKKALLSPFHHAISILAFICIFFFHIPFPIIILGTIAIALLSQQLSTRTLSTKSDKTVMAEPDESEYYINSKSNYRNTIYNPIRFWKQLTTGALLWLMPLVTFYFLTSDFAFWQTLSVFFTKAALVTFGGAYAVLPYVAQVSVEKYNWLTSGQMMDGLALGETTPGPLIMVLAFVGFMAGYNHFENSLFMGSAALVTTTFYTFLPCFLFIFAGAPLIERTKDNKKVKGILALVSASVVGVIINLTLYLGKSVIFPEMQSINELDYIALAWTVVSFVALYRYKAGMILWIFVSAIFGLINYLINN